MTAPTQQQIEAREMNDGEKTSTILEALQKRSSDLICATEPQLGARLRRIDFWTLHPQDGKGHCATAYEIKVSRQDFKRDSAMKQREARLYSDQFYYVTPKGLLKPEEIPDWAGLMEWDWERFTFKVHAPKLSKSVPSWNFVVALLRSATDIRRDTSMEIKKLKGDINLLEWKLKQAKDDLSRLKTEKVTFND